MGGGDLNSKKSWHPNTMKNQERVWKAEQAAAEEKKRMVELQREHAEERDRAELNDILSKRNNASASDDRLSWMYDKPDKKVDQEAYLLGKTLEKNSEQSENAEQDPIPAVSRRVVGSSMLTTAGDAQVDMSRKMREDPLLLIKERERAARAALLNNPLQRRRLTELLRKEQEERKEKKEKKKAKKKDEDLDVLLASKLNALGAGKGVDLAGLLDSDGSSSESDDGKSKKKKKKNKKQKSKKKKKHSSADSDSDYVKQSKKKKKQPSSESDSEEVRQNSKAQYENHERSKKSSEYKHSRYENKDSRKRTSSDDHRCGRSESPVKKKYRNKDDIDSRLHSRDSSYRDRQHMGRDSESYRDKQYRDSGSYRDKQYREKESYESKRYTDSKDKKDETQRYSTQRKSPESVQQSRDYQSSHKRRPAMSEEEKAAKLAEMASAGMEREIQRGVKVAKQRAADQVVESKAPSAGRSRHDARSLPDSLESRIHSTRHYIQRDKRQMNENFARR